MSITVTQFNGPDLELEDIEDSDNMLAVKQAIENETGIPADSILLLYKGHILQNCDIVAPFNLDPNTKIAMFLTSDIPAEERAMGVKGACSYDPSGQIMGCSLSSPTPQLGELGQLVQGIKDVSTFLADTQPAVSGDLLTIASEFQRVLNLQF